MKNMVRYHTEEFFSANGQPSRSRSERAVKVYKVKRLLLITLVAKYFAFAFSTLR